MYEPDLIVASPSDGTTRLVVETKLGGDLGAAADALKGYMIRARVPSGLLVARDVVKVFRDSFRGYSPESIETVQTVPTSEIPELQAYASHLKNDPVDFEDTVYGWLDSLRYRAEHGFLRGSDSRFVNDVVPALVRGDIRVTGPRSVGHAALG